MSPRAMQGVNPVLLAKGASCGHQVVGAMRCRMAAANHPKIDSLEMDRHILPAPSCSCSRGYELSTEKYENDRADALAGAGSALSGPQEQKPA